MKGQGVAGVWAYLRVCKALFDIFLKMHSERGGPWGRKVPYVSFRVKISPFLLSPYRGSLPTRLCTVLGDSQGMVEVRWDRGRGKPSWL